MLTNPRVYSKLIAEIDAATYTSQIITSAEARRLPYLQAVIKEGLRIFPPLVGLASKVSPPGGLTVTTSAGTDLYIPENVEVAESRPMVQRRKDVFGEDANVFRPERWIEAAALGTGEGSAYMKMERCLELVFGTGRYGCLGKNIAMIELDKVLVALLREFELVVVDPMKPLKTMCWVRTPENTYPLSYFGWKAYAVQVYAEHMSRKATISCLKAQNIWLSYGGYISAVFSLSFSCISVLS